MGNTDTYCSHPVRDNGAVTELGDGRKSSDWEHICTELIVLVGEYEEKNELPRKAKHITIDNTFFSPWWAQLQKGQGDPTSGKPAWPVSYCCLPTGDSCASLPRAQLCVASFHQFPLHIEYSICWTLWRPLFCAYTEPTQTKPQEGLWFLGASEVGE